MKVVIAGASGFLGSHLTKWLRQRGHEVMPMVRKRSADGIFWDPASDRIDVEKLNAFAPEAAINLAGESVADRWNPKKKEAIQKSRGPATSLLSTTLFGLKARPKVFLCASAIGYYGERGAEFLTEESSCGSTFLAKVCRDWEAATHAAKDAGIRTVNLRFGIVLSTTGGAFPRMLQPFQMGAGGKVGTGNQYMSWISMDDTLSAIGFAMENEALSGPVNIVSPSPVTNNEFTETLGKMLNVRAMVPVNVTMVHLAFGKEMADEVILASDRVLPEKLSSTGFTFQHTKLQDGLTHVLNTKV